MVASTQVHVEVLDAVAFDDPQLLQVPFVLLTASAPFEFTEAEAAKITYENAMRWYSFDPFAQWLLVDHPEEVWQFCLQAIVPDHKLS